MYVIGATSLQEATEPPCDNPLRIYYHLIQLLSSNILNENKKFSPSFSKRLPFKIAASLRKKQLQLPVFEEAYQLLAQMNKTFGC